MNKTLIINDNSEEHTKGSVLTKTHASKHPNYARKCLDDILMHMKMGFES